MPAIPKMNAPDEQVPFLRYLKQRDEAREKELRDLRLLVSASQKSAISGTDLGARVNVDQKETAAEVAIHHEEIEELKGRPGLPLGGWRGALVTKDEDAVAKWTTPIGSIVPKYYVYLEHGACDYDVNPFGAALTVEDAKKLLPKPLIEDYTIPGVVLLDFPVSWGNEQAYWTPWPTLSDPMPIQIEVYVTPHYDGEWFYISLPSSSSGSGGAPWSIVTVFNSGEHTANVLTQSFETLVYEGGVERPSAVPLVPNEYFSWKIDSLAFDSLSRLQPFWGAWSEGGYTISAPTDTWYWRNVRALEQQESFGWPGDLEVIAGPITWTNGRNHSVRIGKVAARVATPGASDIELQVLRNGVTPIFSSPLVIPAGQVYATRVPDAGGYVPAGGWHSAADALVLMHPDDFLTVDIVAVDGTTPGANLTLQTFYG